MITLREIARDDIPAINRWRSDPYVTDGFASPPRFIGIDVDLQWYDDYLARGSADRSANPTPGNKRGGLANVVEKALGSIAKAGTSALMAVAVLGTRALGLAPGALTLCVTVLVGAVTYVAALAACAPGDARELMTTFGLAGPGARLLRPSLRSRPG